MCGGRGRASLPWRRLNYMPNKNHSYAKCDRARGIPAVLPRISHFAACQPSRNLSWKFTTVAARNQLYFGAWWYAVNVLEVRRLASVLALFTFQLRRRANFDNRPRPTPPFNSVKEQHLLYMYVFSNIYSHIFAFCCCVLLNYLICPIEFQ